ncbi:coiled-coil domain-containing protein 9B isoform X2 [Micropterus dolomieu]|uniref:coiled-coil domain-containing protein 9B isoform X2 n=1 Tax=Micropterus dolomieu TaxID=147949 RepID=UPI001E8EBA3A|nr:coiled-coil domain-containing protein 9B isoform X2 [Micropterus dolomieu]
MRKLNLVMRTRGYNQKLQGKQTPSETMPKKDHERDLELDKKIEALRRKNEMLMKRYKEVEEDRKRAEEEGMALQSRKGKAEDLTITISKSTSDNRVVVTKPLSSSSPAGKGQQEPGPDRGQESPLQGAGRGHRKQLMVTMAGKKGKRLVSERPEKRLGPADVKNSTEDCQARHGESAGRGKQPHHMTRRDAVAQDEDKQGQRHTEEHHRLSEPCQPDSPQASTDLTIPTSKEEQGEYLRWKKEREQIDRERVARHKNAKGQWRRAWDMDKTENMFSDKSLPDRDWGSSSRGGRNARRGQSRAGSDPRGHEKRGKDKGNKNVQVMSSKAKGIDRLTGRARRWQATEEGENLQTSDTLEEFLEELDALTDAEVEDQKDQESKIELSPSPNSLSTSEEVSGSTAPESATPLREHAPTQGKAEASSPRGSEKKVRFSEELVQGTRQTTGSQDSASTEARSLSTLKASSPKPPPHEVQGSQQPLESANQDDGFPQDQGGGPSAPPVAQQQASETECTKKDSIPPTAPSSPSPEKACASLQESSVQLVELAKCNISNTNTEELIDSGLSVLSLESGETNPALSTSSDKAREHGKIV